MAVTINKLNTGSMTVTLDNPALTRVTYTESSGLAPWSGDIPSSTVGGNTLLYGNNIPNAQYIKTVKVGTGVEGQIASESFYGNTNLVSVELPYTVTRVNDTAFYGCSALKTLTISDMTTIENNSVFHGCNAIETVHIVADGGTPTALKEALVAAGVPSTVTWIDDPDE